MVKTFGMSETLGLRVINGDEEMVSDELKSRLDSEIDRVLKESHTRVMKILTDHRDELDIIAKALLLKKTLFAEEIKSLIGDHLSESKISSKDTKANNNGSEKSFELLEEK